MISYFQQRWRVHPKRGTILVAFLFLYAGGLGVISAKATTTYLKVTMQSSSSGIAQIFYDTGSGYSEASSVRVIIAGGSDFSDYLFRLPDKKISQFRFDPLPSAGSFVIRRMEVVSGLGILIRSFALYQVHPAHQIREHKLLDQDLRVVTEVQANDPQLIINLQQPLNLSKIVLLLNPLFFIYALLLFPIILLLMAGTTWAWRKVKVEWFFYFPSGRYKHILFAACVIISLVILSEVHHQSFSNALRYTRVAEGNISMVVSGMWESGMPVLEGTIKGDAHTWGRIRPAHWLFYNIPYALTLVRNGDFFRHDSMVPISNRINGDLQTHTLFLLLCMALSCGGLAWLVWHLSRSWLAFVLFPLYVSLSYTLCENLLVGYADSQEIPQLLWISLYLVSISKIFSGQRPSVFCEVFATLFLLLAYTTKETSVVMLPVCSLIFGLFFVYSPKEQIGIRFFCLRQIGWQVFFSVILVAFVWSFRAGAYVGPNYVFEWQTLLSSFQLSLKIFKLGVPWMNILLLASIPIFLLLMRRIIREQIIERQAGTFLLLIIAVGLCYGFWIVYLPWKQPVAKYYLPAVFWGSFATVNLQIYLADQLRKRGYRAACTIWLLVSCLYLLGDFNRLNSNVQHFYAQEYGYRQSVPIISNDIAASMKNQNKEIYRVHIVGTRLFQEGALPFQRQVNLLYGMNIAVKGQPVRYVDSIERNYFRNYSKQPAAEISLSQSLPDRPDISAIYVCQIPGAKERSGGNLDGFHVSRRWDDAQNGVHIVKYDRI